MLAAVEAMTNLAVGGLNAAGVFATSLPTPAAVTLATAAALVSSN
jgi:hypothetical protein